MSMGQVAIAELRKRVGRVDPVAGFKIIDGIIQDREQALEMFERMAMGWAFHQGQLVATARGDWLEGYAAGEDFDGECLRGLMMLLAHEPALLSEPAEPEPESRLVQLQPRLLEVVR